MAYRFNLQHINWLSALLDPTKVPTISDIPQFREAVHELLSQDETRFMSSLRREREFRDELMELLAIIEHLPTKYIDQADSADYRDVEVYWQRRWLEWHIFRNRFFDRPWMACIVPSGIDQHFDRELCSPELLRSLVNASPENLGLILQPSEPPENHFALLDALPAFSHALNNVSRWPLLLVWSRNDVALLPIGRSMDIAYNRIRLGLKLLYEGVSLDELETQFCEQVEPGVDTQAEPVHIIQVSDVHIGSKKTRTRTRHLSHLVRTLRAELGKRTVPVISGDLFDTPAPELREDVMSFVDEIGRAVGEKPFCVFGNHDLRRGGWAGSQLDIMMNSYLGEPIRTYENYGLSLIGFNSCERGSLGRGKITEAQLNDQNQRIDEHATGIRIGVVHHHPVKVDHPEWEFRHFWERWIEPIHAPTVEMVNGETFLAFCEAKNICTVLHGHKHIPRFADHGRIRIVGCGSSTGLIKTKDKSPYISVNVLTIFPDTGRVITRFLADRNHGGLQEQTRHEFVALS